MTIKYNVHGEAFRPITIKEGDCWSGPSASSRRAGASSTVSVVSCQSIRCTKKANIKAKLADAKKE